MRRGVIRSSESIRNVIEIADYIAQHNYTAAVRFLDAVETTCDFLAANHEVGQLCRFRNPETEGLRVWQVEGFTKHLIFYRDTHEAVVIERVLHGARDLENIFRTDR